LGPSKNNINTLQASNQLSSIFHPRKFALMPLPLYSAEGAKNKFNKFDGEIDGVFDGEIDDG
jgi:hypothetical protein